MAEAAESPRTSEGAGFPEKFPSNGTFKRERGEGEEDQEVVATKQKVEKPVEDEKEEGHKVTLGPKVFGSSSEMFDYFYNLLHAWTPHLDINKYEHLVLLDLLKRGHTDPDNKIRDGIQAFQIRNHPLWKNRCFFLVGVDGSFDDFSFWKCVDQILPLPDNMKPSDGKKAFNHDNRSGGGQGERGGGGRGGRGRRGRF